MRASWQSWMNIAGSFCCSPVMGLLAKTPSHLHQSFSSYHLLCSFSCLLLICIAPSADLIRLLSFIHPSCSFTPPNHITSVHPPPLSFKHAFSHSLTFLPPSTLSINTSHYLCALRKEQWVSGITPTLRGVAAIQVENENILTRTHTFSRDPTHTHAHNHPRNPEAQTPTIIPFDYLIICRLPPNMPLAFLLATLKIHRAGSLLNVISPSSASIVLTE